MIKSLWRNIILEEKFRFEYPVNPARDINGVGLLYYTTYFTIVDEALFHFWQDAGGDKHDLLNRIIQIHRIDNDIKPSITLIILKVPIYVVLQDIINNVPFNFCMLEIYLEKKSIIRFEVFLGDSIGKRCVDFSIILILMNLFSDIFFLAPYRRAALSLGTIIKVGIFNLGRFSHRLKSVFPADIYIASSLFGL